MTFSLTLTITHPGLADPITRQDTLQARTKAEALKYLSLSNRAICELKNSGVTRWRDEHGAQHKLELKHEAN